MSATPTDGFNSVTVGDVFRLAQLISSHETGGGDYTGTKYTFTDEATGTTATTTIEYSTDGNKIADGQGNTWLHVAARGGNDGMIKGFITKGREGLDIDIRNREDRTPFMIAVVNGRQKAAEILLENGADINACIRVQSPEAIAMKSNQSLVGMTALRMAAEKSDVPMVQFLLRNGVNITEDDNACHPLHHVLGKASEGVVRTLIEAGCNPHHITRAGYNALHLAARNPDPNVMSMLITEFHVNPNQKDTAERTPLSYTIDPNVVKLLLENGSETDGMLAQATMFLQWDKLIVLLEHGVTPIEPPSSKDHPFAAMVKSVDRLDQIGLSRVLKLTKLYLAKGAKITSNIKTIFDAYLYLHSLSWKDYPNYKELRELVNENYSSCIIS